jgi:hypothetical protein
VAYLLDAHLTHAVGQEEAMICQSIVSAILACATGIAVAIYWACSAGTKFPTFVHPLGDITKDKQVQLDYQMEFYLWTLKVGAALTKSSRLNKTAAILTAISVFLSAAVLASLPKLN